MARCAWVSVVEGWEQSWSGSFGRGDARGPSGVMLGWPACAGGEPTPEGAASKARCTPTTQPVLSNTHHAQASSCACHPLPPGSLRTSVFSGRVSGVPVFLVRPSDASECRLFRGTKIYGGEYDDKEAYLFFCRRVCVCMVLLSGACLHVYTCVCVYVYAYMHVCARMCALRICQWRSGRGTCTREQARTHPPTHLNVCVWGGTHARGACCNTPLCPAPAQGLARVPPPQRPAA